MVRGNVEQWLDAWTQTILPHFEPRLGFIVGIVPLNGNNSTHLIEWL